MTEKRKVSIRRDLNDLVRGPDGKVSAAKVGMNTGQFIAAYLLVKFGGEVIKHWDSLAILLSALIAPDAIKKLIAMKYQAKP